VREGEAHGWREWVSVCGCQDSGWTDEGMVFRNAGGFWDWGVGRVLAFFLVPATVFCLEFASELVCWRSIDVLSGGGLIIYVSYDGLFLRERKGKKGEIRLWRWLNHTLSVVYRDGKVQYGRILCGSCCTGVTFLLSFPVAATG